MLSRTRFLARHSLRAFSTTRAALQTYHNADAHVMMKVLKASEETDRRVVVDFYADWCGPCKTLSPVIERVAEDPQLDIDLVTVDIDANNELAQHFRVSAVPTVIGFRAGEAKDKFVGARPEPAIRKFVQDL